MIELLTNPTFWIVLSVAACALAGLRKGLQPGRALQGATGGAAYDPLNIEADIRTLRAAVEVENDDEMVAVCDRALAGDAGALAVCTEIVATAYGVPIDGTGAVVRDRRRLADLIATAREL